MLAQKLQAAGVSVAQHTYPGVTHGFFGMGAVVAQAKLAEDSAAARLKASNALAGRCTARLSAPVSEKTPAWLGGTYVYSDRPTREKLPTTCSPCHMFWYPSRSGANL